MMASTAASKWSMSIHSDDRLALRLKLHAARFYPLLSIPVIVLYCLILCGCLSSAPLIHKIFLFEFLNSQTETTVHIRVSYFGICSSNNNRDFTCSSSMLAKSRVSQSSLSAAQLATRYAVDLQKAISFVPLSISAVVFLGGIVSLFTLQLLLQMLKRSTTLREIPSPDKHVTNLVLASRIIFWVAAGVSVVAAYSTHCAISAVQITTSTEYGRVIGGKLRRGISVEIMQWAVCLLSVSFAACVQIFTRPRREKFTNRKSKLGRNRQDIINLITPPRERLTFIGGQDLSQQSIVEQSSGPSVSRTGSMKQLISPDRLQPHSPAIGTDHLMPKFIAEGRAISPLLPNFITEPGTQRHIETHQKSQLHIRPMTAEEKSTASPLSPNFPWDQSMQGRPLTRTRSQRMYRPGGSGEVSPALPLQSILKMSTPTALPRVQSPLGTPLRPGTAPKSEPKSAWV